MSDWSISFDDELEKIGYRVKWTAWNTYDVYAPGEVLIDSGSRSKQDARTAAWDHFHKNNNDGAKYKSAYLQLAAQVRRLGIVADVQIMGNEISFGDAYDALQTLQMVQICVATLNDLTLKLSKPTL